MSDGKTIWSDPTRTRHFVIPDDATLPSGDFALRTITGRQQQVDPEAVAPYEVSENEAVEWLKSQLGQAVEDAKGAVMDSIREKTAFKPDLDAWIARDRAKDPPYRRRPQPRTGADPAARLQGDPAAVTEGMERLVAGLQDLLKDALATGEAGPRAAQAKIDQFDALLRQYGVSTGPWSGALVSRIRDLHQSVLDTPDPVRSAENLETIADSIEAAAKIAAGGLRSLAHQVRTSADEESPDSPEQPQDTDPESGRHPVPPGGGKSP